jgi:hypothetical protein
MKRIVEPLRCGARAIICPRESSPRGLHAHPVDPAHRHPGHTAEDITTLAATPALAAAPADVYACTLAGARTGRPMTPPGTDQAALHQSRAQILAVATVTCRGMAPPFAPARTRPASAALHSFGRRSRKGGRREFENMTPKAKKTTGRTTRTRCFTTTRNASG